MVNFIGTAIFYSNKNFTMASELKKICRECRINVVNVCGVFELLEKYHQIKPNIFIFDCSSINVQNNFLGKIMESELSGEDLNIFYIKNENSGVHEQSTQDLDTINLSDFKYILHEKIDLINTISKHRKFVNFDNAEMFDKTSKFLLYLGFSPKHSGYLYLKEIVFNLLCSGDNCGSLINDLYPSIAVKFKTCACNIERNIRNAITCAWAKHGKKIWKDYFLSLNRQNCRPSNREFILMCLDFLKANNNNLDSIVAIKSATN